MPILHPLFATLSVLLAGAACAQTAEDVDTDLAARYGFSGLHISKLSDGLAGLTAGDLDGDGRGDLAVINNAKARIELLMQRRGDEDPSQTFEAELDRINELPDELWFRRDALPTEEKVSSLATADLDGDGRDELIFTGDSGRLSVAFRDGDGSYGRLDRYRLEEGAAGPGTVRVGDLDGDSRIDVAVLGERATWLHRNDAEGRLLEATALPHANGNPDDLALCDLDGDGRLDLLHVVRESEWPFRWRLGRGGMAFGPQGSTRFTPIRSFAVHDVGGDARHEVIAVRQRSGRLTMLRLEPAAHADAPLSDLRSVPFDSTRDAARRQATLDEIDGDGLPDLVVAEPGAARVVTYRAATGYEAEVWPSLLGAGHPHVVDTDGDGTLELVISAPDEQAVGIAQIGASGVIGFPRAVALPGAGELLALDVETGPPVRIWVVLGEGRGRSRTRSLIAMDGSGAMLRRHELQDLEVDPANLLLADLDRDGATDGLLSQPTELPAILTRIASEQPVALPVERIPGLGILEGVDPNALFVGDVDGDGLSELMVPGPNFARAFHLDAQGLPVVVAQVNLAGPASRAGPVSSADLDGDGRPEILIVDRSSRQLSIHSIVDGASVLKGRLELGEEVPRRLIPADLDADGRIDLAVESERGLGLAHNGGGAHRLVPALDFELPARDAHLDRVALGDLGGDESTDLVMTDTSGHRLAIASVGSEAIQHAMKFPVFEGRLFESGRGGREPREVLVAEVTGDDLVDVALVVHDRVIVYPQE
jgi:hypothetical protein